MFERTLIFESWRETVRKCKPAAETGERRKRSEIAEKRERERERERERRVKRS